MAQDMIKETYDILNYHLGEKHRGMVRLDDKYEPLKKDLERFIVHMWHLGVAHGKRQTLDSLSNSINNITAHLRTKTVQEVQQYAKPESRGGMAKAGWAARNPEKEVVDE